MPATLPSLPAPDLLPDLLEVSLTGIILFAPVFDPADPAVITDLAYVHLNPAAQRMLALPEQPTATFLELYPHAVPAGIFAFYHDAFLSGQPGRLDVNYQHDGLDNYFYLAARRSGELLLVSFTDTADHSRTAVELALRESQARERAARAEVEAQRRQLEIRVQERTQALHQAQTAAEASARQLLHLTESLPSTTFTVEASGRVVYVSPQWYAYTGMALDAPIAEQWATLIHADDLPAVAREFGGALAEGRAWRYEFRLRGADGCYRWFASQGVPEPLADAQAAGRARRWYGSNLDIDDLKQAQLRLEQQDQQLTDILSSLPAGVVTFDAEELRYTFFNDPFQQQVQGRAVLGARLTELFPEAEEQGFVALLRQVLDTGQPYVVHELPSFLRDPHTGQEQPQFTDVAYVPLRQNPEAPTYGVLSYSIDATERVLTRRQGEAAQAQAIAADQRLRLLTESLPLMVYTTDPEGKITYLSPQWWAYTGQDPAHLDPIATLVEATHPDELPALGQSLHETAARAETWEAKLRLRRHDGQYRWHLSRAVPQLDEATGAVVAWHGSFTDIHELLEAQAALQAERQQLTSILSLVPAAVATFVGPEHRYAFFNDTHQHLFGGRAWLGGSLSEIYPEVVPQGFVGLLDGVYTTGQPFVGTDVPATVEVDGQTQQYYIDFVYQPMPDAQGQTMGILAFAVDVTEKVRARQQAEALQAQVLAAAEQAAAQRETFFQVFEQTPAAIALLRGPKHHYEYVNPSYQQFFPGRALLGLDLAVALPEALDNGFVALMDNILATGEGFSGVEVPVEFPAFDEVPARTLYFDVTYQAIWEQGAIVGVSVFGFDVTERVRVRRQRAAQQQQLETLFRDVPAPIVIYRGPELAFEFINPAYQRMFPGRELLGKPLVVALPELAGNPLLDVLNQVYDTGETKVFRELPLRLARYDDGPLEDVYLTFTYQPRRDEHGRIDGALAFAYEVTDQVLARQQVQQLNQELAASNQELAVINGELSATNEELQAANQQLIRANTELDTFVYTASHDLKTPIANIEGLLHALLEELPAPVRQAGIVPVLLSRMQGAVDRFQLTVAQLADLSRLQLLPVSPPEAVDLAALAEAVRLDLSPALEAARGHLEVDVAACPTLSFSPKNMRSILFNLLSNAIKYRHPDRTPRVRLRAARAASGAAVLEVEDNGLGLSEKQQSRLFGLFQRQHDHVEGSGVGLYTVKRIIDNAEGTIAVRSQLGVGTTFTVTLPHA